MDPVRSIRLPPCLALLAVPFALAACGTGSGPADACASLDAACAAPHPDARGDGGAPLDGTPPPFDAAPPDAVAPDAMAPDAPDADTTDPLASRVLVVYNRAEPDSLAVAEHYLSRRRIPRDNLCAIAPSNVSGIDWPEYLTAVRDPVRACLEARGPDAILYIVFSYRTPFRVGMVPMDHYSAFNMPGTSLDSHIADPYEVAPRGVHGYYAFSQSMADVFMPYVSLADYRAGGGQRIYSVWRLDAATADLARGLVDKAIQAETAGLMGQGCFDRNRGAIGYASADTGYLAGDWDMYRAAQLAREMGYFALEDGNDAEFGTAPAPPRCDNAALYAGWYALNHYNDAFSWAPGAIGFHLDSGSALDPRGGANWSANAIQHGITVTAGAVGEPYVEGLPRYDGLFRNLFEGSNVGDALLRNTTPLRWMVINLGDPLYRPFRGGSFPTDWASLPAPWRVGDTGPMGMPTRATIRGGNLIVRSMSGAPTASADAYGSALQPLHGDGQITAHVQKVEFPSAGAWAGVVVTERAAPDGPRVALGRSGQDATSASVRMSMGAGAMSTMAPMGAGAWLRITRTGDRFVLATSVDGMAWTDVWSGSVTMAAEALVGLMVTSGDVTRANQSTFDHVMVTP